MQLCQKERSETMIFARTDAGQKEAYSSTSELPRNLRSILKLVDGTTTLRMFEENLKSFGDIKAILYSLAESGLIRALPDGAQHFRVNMDATDAERQRLMELRHTADWHATRSPYAEHSQPAHAAVTTRPGSYSQPISLAQSDASAEKLANALKVVVSEMATFVLTHIPDQSFSLLKEIEEITSFEQLAATLGGYQQMVAHLGEASDRHLLVIKQAIRENL